MQGGRRAKGQGWKWGGQMVESTCARDKRHGHYGYRNTAKTDGQTEGKEDQRGWTRKVGLQNKTNIEGVR